MINWCFTKSFYGVPAFLDYTLQACLVEFNIAAVDRTIYEALKKMCFEKHRLLIWYGAHDTANNRSVVIFFTTFFPAHENNRSELFCVVADMASMWRTGWVSKGEDMEFNVTFVLLVVLLSSGESNCTVRLLYRHYIY